MNKFLIAAIALLAIIIPMESRSQLIVHGAPHKFLETEVHLLAGGSYVTENYKSCYNSISDVNNSMGFAWGIGFRAKFNISSFIGLGTEFNYLRNSGKTDLTDVNDQTSVSNVTIKNNYRTANIPVFASFSFNLAPSIRWNADGGLFFTFGMGGKRKATIYNTKLNDLGQLETQVTHNNTDYYKSRRAFLNSYRDFDYGLHLATGLTFFNKVSIGARCQFGFRNVAMSTGLKKPNSHNIGVFATAGYIF